MNLRHTPLAAALLAVFSAPAFIPQAAFAQTPQTENVLPEVQVTEEGADETYAPGLSTVGGRVPTAVRDIPQSVTIINRAVLDAQNATTLTDALRNVPGITLGAGEGGNIGDNISIRGYSSRTDLFLDGMRDRAQYARETFFLESVEVLKGSSSMLFGRGSTGGVINQVSKQAGLRDFAEVGVGIGTDSYYRGTVDVNRALSDTSAIRVNALAHTNDSTRDVVDSTRYGLAGSLRFGIGTPTEITLSAVSQRRDDIPDYGFPIPAGTKQNPGKPIDQDIDNFYGFTNDKFDQDVDIANLRIEHKFSPNLTLRNQTQYATADTFANPTVNTVSGTNLTRTRRVRDITDESLSNQTDLIAKFDTGTVKHTLITGLELARDKYENSAYRQAGPAQSQANPVYGPFTPTGAPSNFTDDDNTADTIGIYVNDTLELNKQWKLVAGLRWDRFEFDGTHVADGVASKLSQDDTKVSHRLGLLYQPTETQSYYISYGTSFNPSAEAVTLSEANQGVDPEENTSYELGAKWDLYGGRLALNTAVFRVEKDNARSRNEFDEVVSTGKTRVDGFELSAAGRIGKNLEIFGGYSYLDGEIVNLDETASGVQVSRDGNVLPNTPKHSASLWTNYRLGGGWEVGGGAVYSAERITNNANTAEVPGYTRYDATVAYVTKKYDVRLNVMNLNDKEYFDVASGGRATPATGRMFVASANYRF